LGFLSIESDHKQLSGDVSADDKLPKSKKPNKNVSYYSILFAKLNVTPRFFFFFII